jgi:hypothetical protein
MAEIIAGNASSVIARRQVVREAARRMVTLKA